MCDLERSKGPVFRLRDSRRDAGATSTPQQSKQRCGPSVMPSELPPEVRAGNYSRDGRPAGQVYFGTSEQFWLNLQDAFAVHQVKGKLHKGLRAIKPFAAAAAR